VRCASSKLTATTPFEKVYKRVRRILVFDVLLSCSPSFRTRTAARDVSAVKSQGARQWPGRGTATRLSVALGFAGRAIDETCQDGCKRKSDLKVRRCKSFILTTMMRVSVGNKVRPIGAYPESGLWHTLFKRPSKNQDLSRAAPRSYAVKATPTASPCDCRVERVSPSILRYRLPLSQI
jgi:hypothetical protein